MFLLVQNARLLGAPQAQPKDILVCAGKIVGVGPALEAPRGSTCETLDAEGREAIPGLVDLHVHIAGGGGEGGYGYRTPGLTAAEAATAGVTTVAGCLGFDDLTRRPEGLLAKAYQLEAQGLTTVIYTGAYRLPPATITGSVRGDIALIPKVIGVGEVAVSDHRSSQPEVPELARLAAEARLGGLMAGKPGVVHLHLGDGRSGLEPVARIVRETELPPAQFLPTHVNRNPDLFEQALAFAATGGPIDLTATHGRSNLAPWADRALSRGIPWERLTVSSDANGSLPEFDEAGRLRRTRVARIGALLDDLRSLWEAGVPKEDALALFTINPARRLGLAHRKGTLEPGKDADIVLLGPGGEVETVIAGGRVLVREGRWCPPGGLDGV